MQYITQDEAIEKLNIAITVIIRLLQMQVIQNQALVISRQKALNYDSLEHSYNELLHCLQANNSLKFENDMLWSIMELNVKQHQAVNEAIESMEKVSELLSSVGRYVNPGDNEILVPLFDSTANLISGELRKYAEALKQEFWTTEELNGL